MCPGSCRSNVLEELSEKAVQTRREYGSQGVAMPASRTNSDANKNSHLAATWTRISGTMLRLLRCMGD